jgi:chaperone modulatory protein CbpM
MSGKYSIIKIHRALLAEDEQLTLMQISRLCRLPPAGIVDMVNEGILEPSGASVCAWRFSFPAVDRVRKVIRIQNDLDVNLAGAALALDLLERIAHLEAMLKRR